MSVYPRGSFTKVDAVVQRGNTGADALLLPVAASQTIQEGDLLVLSSGLLAQAVALPGSNNSWSASGGSLGTMYVAAAPIVTGGSVNPEVDRIPVYNLNAVHFLCRIYAATAADSQQIDLAVGTSYRVGRWRGASASEWWYALSTNATNGDVTYVAPSPESAPTDNFGLVLVGK
jgi:hypothetical protein